MTTEAARPLPPEVLDAVYRLCSGARKHQDQAFPPTFMEHAEATEACIRQAHADLAQAVALLDRARRPAGVEKVCPRCEGRGDGLVNGTMESRCPDCGGTCRVVEAPPGKGG